MPLDGDGGAKLPQEDNGVMPLGGDRREVEAIGGVMSSVAGCGAMPLDGDGGAKLPQEDNGVMPLGDREDA
ncbi:hypothetical protein TRIUR3_35400 [Triticum urartu]|uniref:Uncharacterized protein n=1 Tax=Triticum urartu TaxID=4572 RepID=M7ZCK4_TRIUA|nr:hypothetical protein TRIUR3_35400 [Triticum urartu]